MEHQRNEEVLERIGKEIAQITHNKKDAQKEMDCAQGERGLTTKKERK